MQENIVIMLHDIKNNRSLSINQPWDREIHPTPVITDS